MENSTEFFNSLNFSVQLLNHEKTDLKKVNILFKKKITNKSNKLEDSERHNLILKDLKFRHTEQIKKNIFFTKKLLHLTSVYFS